jgi:hypothetical protein
MTRDKIIEAVDAFQPYPDCIMGVEYVECVEQQGKISPGHLDCMMAPGYKDKDRETV